MKKFSILILLTAFFNYNSIFGQTGQQLLAAAEAAVTNLDKTSFTTMLSGASTLAMAYVNTKVYVLRRNLYIAHANGEVTAEQIADRLAMLAEIQNDLEIAKNGKCDENDKKEKDEGSDPFFAAFTFTPPLSLPLPPEITLTLYPLVTPVSYFRHPEIWSGDFSSPATASANISVQFSGQSSISFQTPTLSYVFDPFMINGASSGTTYVEARPGSSPGNLRIIPQPLSPTFYEFEAHLESILYNDLYPQTNPIVSLCDMHGCFDIINSRMWVMADDPAIFPGAPGVSAERGEMRISMGARAHYDADTKILTFGDNVHLNQSPDILVLRDLNGDYQSLVDPDEPLIGMGFQIGPMTYQGKDEDGDYRFSNTTFSIGSEETTLANGTLSDIKLEIDECKLSFDLNLSVINVETTTTSPSPFLDEWLRGTYHEIKINGPVATIDLRVGSEEFTKNWTTNSFWMHAFAENFSLAAREIPKEELQVQVFPNPTNGELNVNLNFTKDMTIRLEMVNMQGKVIKLLTEQAFARGEHSLHYNLADMPAGVYMLRIKSGMRSTTLKVVRTH